MDVDQRLVAAVRDVAAYTASHQRAPWRLGWREAADLIDLRIERSDPPGAGRVVVCHYDIPSEGATGYFEVDIDTDADLVNGVLESYVRTSATWLQSSGVRRGSDLTHGVASTDRLPAIEGAGGRNYWTRYPGNRGRVKIWLSRSP